MGQQQRILCIFFPAFRIQTIARQESGFENREVVLFRRGRKGAIVEEVSPSAQREGVSPGMTLVQARSRCDDLRELEAEPERDALLLAETADSFFALSPSVAACAPDVLFCDLTGSESIYGTGAELREHIEQFVQNLGYDRFFCAIAENASAAKALALFSGLSWQEVSPGKTSEALASLPVEALGGGEDVCHSLRKVGLLTVGQIASCPVPTLIRRYGELGRDMSLKARALDWKKPEPHRSADSLLVFTEFQDPCGSLEQLLFSAKRHLDVLQGRMGSRGVAGVRVHWELGTEEGAVRGDIGLPRPQRSAQVLLSILRERWEGLVLESPIQSLEIEISETTVGGEEIQDLFERRVSSGEGLDALLARLGAALGENKVYSPELASTHRPEGAMRMKRFEPTLRSSSLSKPSLSRADNVSEKLRPTLLLKQPEPIWWLTGRKGPAVRHVQLGTWPVIRLSPPERILGEWWKDGFSRDYHTLVIDSGAVWWVFRDLELDGWFLHGVFD